MPETVESFVLRDNECLPGLYIEADAPVCTSRDWVVPLALLEAMIAGRPLTIRGPVSPCLERNLQSIQDIYSSWLPAAKKVPVSTTTATSENAANGTSVFFSGGVDSFYSLLKHLDSIDSIILVHGFDIPIDDEGVFEKTSAVAKEVAALFDKRLIIVKTNLRELSHPCPWGLHHGAALASVAHALQPIHSTVYVGSTHPYKDLHIWGSHPLLDPLWSSGSVRIVHDGAETDRVGKLKLICQHPNVIKYLRVCWQNTGRYNCGTCEKCLRTMVGLLGMNALQQASFPMSSVDAIRIRRIPLDDDSVLYWRELLALDLPADLRSAVEHAIRNYEWSLPPHGAGRMELRRVRSAARQLGTLCRAFLS